MSIEAINAVYDTFPLIRERLLSIPASERPSMDAVVAVSQYLANRYRTHRGYVDETVGQIADACCMSERKVKRVLAALDSLGVWVREAKGNRHGASRRVPAFLAADGVARLPSQAATVEPAVAMVETVPMVFGDGADDVVEVSALDFVGSADSNEQPVHNGVHIVVEEIVDRVPVPVEPVLQVPVPVLQVPVEIPQVPVPVATRSGSRNTPPPHVSTTKVTTNKTGATPAVPPRTTTTGLIQSSAELASIIRNIITAERPTQPMGQRNVRDTAAADRVMKLVGTTSDPQTALREIGDIVRWALGHQWWGSQVISVSSFADNYQKISAQFHSASTHGTNAPRMTAAQRQGLQTAASVAERYRTGSQ